MTITPQDLILVTGGTGKSGRRVVSRLVAAGQPVRVASRTQGTRFDWEDRATWAPALDGVAAAYLAYHPDLAAPGAAETVGAFAELAAERGVRRLVLLSGRGEEEAQRAEALVRAAGVAWTVVRCAWFAQNFSESLFAEPVVAGELALPVDRVREPFVDLEDVADVAVAALTDDGHAGRVYELTGPRLLSFAEAAAEIAEAVGRPVRFVPIALEAFDAALADVGVDPGARALLAYLFGEVLDGRNETLADGVQRALGREPRDFRAFARDAAAAGAWDPVAVAR
jgi:uncharacterized protein YbjT (DUF2867 family)